SPGAWSHGQPEFEPSSLPRAARLGEAEASPIFCIAILDAPHRDAVDEDLQSDRRVEFIAHQKIRRTDVALDAATQAHALQRQPLRSCRRRVDPDAASWFELCVIDERDSDELVHAAAAHVPFAGKRNVTVQPARARREVLLPRTTLLVVLIATEYSSLGAPDRVH